MAPLSRRKFLRIIGGGIIVAAGASTAGFLTTRTPHRAREPWQRAGSYDDIRRYALSYAILAPNPHNRQPWLVDLDTPGVVMLYADTHRKLKETDPYDRQITIGLGCFLELAIQAAANRGHTVDLELFPKGENTDALDQRPVARLLFHKDKSIQPDPLFAQVLHRRSYKDPFDPARSVDDRALRLLEDAVGNRVGVGTSNRKADIAALRELTWHAFQREYQTPGKLQESIDLMRLGKSEIETSPDGIDMGGPFLETLILFGVLNRENLANPTSQAFQQGLDMMREVFATGQAYVWLTTPGNDRVAQIDTGRAWVRLNLAATGIGLDVHPISQALQEYAEMKEFYQQIHKRLAAPGDTVQMLGRLGYAEDEAPPSPRWPLETRIQRG